MQEMKSTSECVAQRQTMSVEGVTMKESGDGHLHKVRELEFVAAVQASELTLTRWSLVRLTKAGRPDYHTWYRAGQQACMVGHLSLVQNRSRVCSWMRAGARCTGTHRSDTNSGSTKPGAS